MISAWVLERTLDLNWIRVCELDWWAGEGWEGESWESMLLGFCFSGERGGEGPTPA